MNLREELSAIAAETERYGPMPRTGSGAWHEPEPGVKVRIVPACAHRGAVVFKREVPCCGGKVRRNVVFACSHPGNAGHEAPDAMCAGCRLVQDAEPYVGAIIHVINTYNEGADLLQTILSFRAACLRPDNYRAVVIADMTTDGSHENLPDYATVYHNPGPDPLGCGQAKDYALAKIDGPVFVIHSDGHNRALEGSLDRLAHVSRDGQCIVQPALGPLHCQPNEQASGPRPDNCYYGGTIFAKRSGLNVDLSIERPAEVLHRTPAAVFSTFGYMRDIAPRFGGWNRYPGRWGSQEVGLSLRAWYADVPIITVGDVCVLHRYRDWDGKGKRGLPYTVGEPHRVANHHYAIGVVSDPETYEQFWRPMLRKHRPSPDAEKLLAASAFEEQRTQFLTKCKKRSDDDFFREVLGVGNPLKQEAKPVRGLYIVGAGVGNMLLAVPAMKALARLCGGPIDVWDKKMKIAAGLDLLREQPFIGQIIPADRTPEWTQYGRVVSGYITSPPASIPVTVEQEQARQEFRTKHETVSCMDAIRRLGYDGHTPSARLRCRRYAAVDLPLDFIAVGVAADGFPGKHYPAWPEVFAALRNGRELVFLGAEAESEPWMAEVGLDLCGKTTFPAAAGVLELASLYVGIDNGLSHLAAAVGTPMLLLYGPTSQRKNHPWGLGVHVMPSPLECAPCWGTTREGRCNPRRNRDCPCMAAIEPERVIAEIRKLLEDPVGAQIDTHLMYCSRGQWLGNRKLKAIQERYEIGEFMQIARDLRPRTIVELGAHHAGWSYLIAGVCAPGAQFIVVDKDPNDNRKLTLDELGFQDFAVMEIIGDAHGIDTIDQVRIALDGRTIDLLHIDADHAEASVMADYEAYRDRMTPGGIIAFHDVYDDPSPGARIAWEKVRHGYHGVEILHRRGNDRRYGIGAIHIPRSPRPDPAAESDPQSRLHIDGVPWQKKGTLESPHGIVIPLYKSQPHVSDLAHSLGIAFAQRHCVWVSDGDGLYADVPGRQLVRPVNGGFAVACNEGARHTVGAYVCLVNADVVVKPNWLDPLITAMEEHPKLGIVAPVMRARDNGIWACGSDWDANVRHTVRCLRGQRDHEDLRKPIIPRLLVPFACVLFRRECWDALGGLDEAYVRAYYEDSDMCLRALEAGWHTAVVPASEITHLCAHGGAYKLEHNSANRMLFERRWVESGRIDELRTRALKWTP